MLIDWSKMPYLLFEADKGTGNGEDDKTDDATGSDENGGDDNKPEPKFTQADIDRIVTERLERERKKSEANAQKAKEQAEAKALEEQQKFQELAEKRGTKVAELESTVGTLTADLEAATEEAKRYKAALNGLLEKQRKAVPEHLVALLDKLDPVEQLEWLSNNTDKLISNNGVPATPKGQNGMTEAQKQEASKDAQRFYRSRF